MFNIYGYISPSQSLWDELTFSPAENAGDAVVLLQHRGTAVIYAQCSGAFPKMCVTAAYGHQRMTPVIQKQ